MDPGSSADRVLTCEDYAPMMARFLSECSFPDIAPEAATESSHLRVPKGNGISMLLDMNTRRRA